MVIVITPKKVNMLGLPALTLAVDILMKNIPALTPTPPTAVDYAIYHNVVDGVGVVM
jgi:hypothetical protein